MARLETFPVVDARLPNELVLGTGGFSDCPEDACSGDSDPCPDEPQPGDDER